jgi:hypothetical protein
MLYVLMFPADLVELAERTNGTDLNGDGVPDWSVCHVLTYSCQAPHILLDIATNALQYEGPKQGCLFGAWLPLCKPTDYMAAGAL